MGFFDKVKASVGIGGAKVELQLEPGAVPRGSYVKGNVIVRAGKLEQTCNGVIVALKRSKVVRQQNSEGKMQDVTVTDTLAEDNLAQYQQALRPGDQFHYTFSLMVPDEGGEEQRVTYEVSASADIPGAIDPSDSKKVPTSAPQAFTAANIPQMLDTAVNLERQGDKGAQLQAMLKQIIGLDATNTQALKMLARAMRYDSPAEAATYYKKYLDVVPADGEIWQEFAQSALDRSSFQEALGYSDKAVELMPNSSYAWETRARILDKLGKVDDAVAAYGKAKAGDYPSNRIDVDVAQMLQRAGRLQEAAQAFLSAGKKGDPYTLEDILEGLKAAGAAGHDDELIDLAKKSKPDEYWAWQVHAKWALETNPQQSITAADEALTKKVNSDWSRADLWVIKGRAFEKLQNKDEAKVAYEKALAACKDHHDAKQRLKAL